MGWRTKLSLDRDSTFPSLGIRFAFGESGGHEKYSWPFRRRCEIDYRAHPMKLEKVIVRKFGSYNNSCLNQEKANRHARGLHQAFKVCPRHGE